MNIIAWFKSKLGKVFVFVKETGKWIVFASVAAAITAGFILLPGGEIDYLVVEVNGQIIEFPYTDDNLGENTDIFTDREYYGAFNESEIITSYILVKNNSGKGQNMNIYPLFADYVKDIKIARLYKDVPYDKEIDVYEEQCSDVINSTTTISETICKDVLIGTSTQIAYKDEWNTELLLSFDKSEINLNLSKGNLKRKLIPSVYKANRKSVVYIESDEIAYFRLQFHGVPVGITDEFFIEVVGDKGAYGHLDPVITSDWEGYFPITASTTITGTHTNFPLLYNGINAPSNCTSVLQADTEDLRITATTTLGSTVLDNELVSATTTAGSWQIYFRDPSFSSSTDGEIYYIWCGNDGASDISTTSVWNSDYRGVYHFEEDPSTSTTTDSTINGNFGTSVGSMTSGDLVDAQIGKGYDFDDTDDAIVLGTGFQVGNLSAFTITAWSSSTIGSGVATIYSEGRTSSSNPFNQIFINNTGNNGTLEQISRSDAGGSIGGAGGSTDLRNNGMHYVVSLRRAADNWEVYEEGISTGTDGTSVGGMTLDRANIGRECLNTCGNPGYYGGIIDELRIIATNLSDNWIDAQYKIQFDQSAFWTVGSWVSLGGERRIILPN